MSHNHHYMVPTFLNLSYYKIIKFSINKLKYAMSLDC